MNSLTSALEEVLMGELGRLAQVLGVAHEELVRCVQAGGVDLCVKKEAVKRVIQAWRAGKWSDQDVQRWASFVMRGFVVTDTRGAIRPLDITYEKEHQGVLVEVLARLDELGDGLKGKIEDKEAQEMLDVLNLSTSSKVSSISVTWV